MPAGTIDITQGASANPFDDLIPKPSGDLYGPFADLATGPTIATQEAAAEPVVGNQLIGGGTADAPAYQIVNGRPSNVPIGAPVSTTDYGPFDDLVKTGPRMAPTDVTEAQFGPFQDLVPKSPTSETEKALDETPTLPETVVTPDATPKQSEISASDPAFSHPAAQTFWDELKNDVGDMVPAFKSIAERPGISPSPFASIIKNSPAAYLARAVAGMTNDPAVVDDVINKTADKAGEFFSGLTTPENGFMIGAMAGTPELLSKLVSAGFSLQASRQMYDESKNLAAAKTPGERASAVTGILLDGAMATLTGVHAAEDLPSIVSKIRGTEAPDYTGRDTTLTQPEESISGQFPVLVGEGSLEVPSNPRALEPSSPLALTAPGEQQDISGLQPDLTDQSKTESSPDTQPEVNAAETATQEPDPVTATAFLLDNGDVIKGEPGELHDQLRERAQLDELAKDGKFVKLEGFVTKSGKLPGSRPST